MFIKPSIYFQTLSHIKVDALTSNYKEKIAQLIIENKVKVLQANRMPSTPKACKSPTTKADLPTLPTSYNRKL
jgi:hypothetical protein